MMKKLTLNLLVDLVMLLCLDLIVGIGFLIEYILVPGSERRAIYGANVDLTFWGMDRHQWGEVHYTAGLVFAALVVLHIILHWSIIVGWFRRTVKRAALRWAIGLLLFVISAALAVLPFFVKPEVGEEQGGRGSGIEGGRGYGWGAGRSGR